MLRIPPSNRCSRLFFKCCQVRIIPMIDLSSCPSFLLPLYHWFSCWEFLLFPLSHLLFPSLRCHVFERVSTLVTSSPLPLPHSLAALGGHQQLLTTEPPADVQASSPRPLWVNPALFPTVTLPFLPPVAVLFLFLPHEHNRQDSLLLTSFWDAASTFQAVRSPQTAGNAQRYTPHLLSAGLPSLSVVSGKSRLPFPFHGSTNLTCYLAHGSSSSPSQ